MIDCPYFGLEAVGEIDDILKIKKIAEACGWYMDGKMKYMLIRDGKTYVSISMKGEHLCSEAIRDIKISLSCTDMSMRICFDSDQSDQYYEEYNIEMYKNGCLKKELYLSPTIIDKLEGDINEMCETFWNLGWQEVVEDSIEYKRNVPLPTELDKLFDELPF